VDELKSRGITLEMVAAEWVRHYPVEGHRAEAERVLGV
jgi:hypothetical protein